MTHIKMDRQFEPMRAKMAGIGISLSTVTSNEHVPETEHGNRTIKEHIQCTFHSLPYNNMLKIMVVELARNSVYWINAFPYVDSISNTHGPAGIVVGHIPSFTNHCTLEVSTYYQVHNDGMDNIMTSRTTSVIALHPNGKTHGGHHL